MEIVVQSIKKWNSPIMGRHPEISEKELGSDVEIRSREDAGKRAFAGTAAAVMEI